MPFINHIVENDLKSLIPEISRLLWSDETDYSLQKAEAEKFVMQDLLDRGFKARDLMPQLVLRNSGTALTETAIESVSNEDVISRLRFVYQVTGFTAGGTKQIILEGTNDKETYYTVKTISVTANASTSLIIPAQYKYYRVSATVTGGSMDYSAYLVETTFDRLITFKWLELILLDRYVEEDDQYHSKMMYCQKGYNSLWNTITIWRDSDASGDIDSSEKVTTNSITMLK